MNKNFYRYIVFILFLLFSLLVVYVSNEMLILDGGEASTNKYLFIQFAMLFALGASFHLLTSAELRLRIRATKLTFILSLVLIIANYLAAVYQGSFYTLADGMFNMGVRILLDAKNQLIYSLLAGYLFGCSFVNKK